MSITLNVQPHVTENLLIKFSEVELTSPKCLVFESGEKNKKMVKGNYKMIYLKMCYIFQCAT